MQLLSTLSAIVVYYIVTVLYSVTQIKGDFSFRFYLNSLTEWFPFLFSFFLSLFFLNTVFFGGFYFFINFVEVYHKVRTRLLQILACVIVSVLPFVGYLLFIVNNMRWGRADTSFLFIIFVSATLIALVNIQLFRYIFLIDRKV
jgi:hypothetical protein